MAVTLRFDLPKILNENEKDRKKRQSLLPLLSRNAVKTAFARQAIDLIEERTVSGIDKRGNSFVGYSDAYKKSLEFKIFKGSKKKADLKLTGAMLAHMQIVSTDRTGVTIGIQDSEQAGKAEGHIMGSGNLPVRDFWGVSNSEQYKILKNVIREQNLIDELGQIEDALTVLAASAVAERIDVSDGTDDGIDALTLLTVLGEDDG